MRIEGKRYRDEWLPNFYRSRELAPDRWLRISRTGKTVVLSAAEDRQISEIYMDAPLYERLERTGHILIPANATRVFQELKLWQLRYYAGPELQIVVTTATCNLACTYCHMNPQPLESSADEFDMSPETARAVVEFAMSSPNSRGCFEFQGGEPFLNFAAIRAVVEHAEAINRAAGLKEMIDFYFDEGFNGVGLIRLKPLGFARKGELKFGITRFMEAYLGGLEYILDKNKTSGRAFQEYMVPVVLAKILGESDMGFVDWRNPCGDISGAIIYDYDGEILPVDEARSMRDVFALGNVRSVTYEELMRGK